MEKRGRRNVVVRTIGCTRDEGQLKWHEMQTRKELDGLSPRVRLDFGGSARERSALELLKTGWDGLMGYLTNAARNPGEIIGNYRQL